MCSTNYGTISGGFSPNRFLGSMKIPNWFCNIFINFTVCTLHSKWTPAYRWNKETMWNYKPCDIEKLNSFVFILTPKMLQIYGIRILHYICLINTALKIFLFAKRRSSGLYIIFLISDSQIFNWKTILSTKADSEVTNQDSKGGAIYALTDSLQLQIHLERQQHHEKLHQGWQ